MAKLTFIRTENDVEVEDKGTISLLMGIGSTGLSAYELYLATTSDDPKMTLSEWLQSLKAVLPDNIVIDDNYVHTDNNYDDAAVAEVAKIADKANSADVYTKSETYSQTEINNKLSAVYKFKGSVLTYDLLPIDAENADVWNVVNGITPELNGMNYAWNSTLSAWDAIGGIVGLATLTENGLMSKEDFKKLSDLYTKYDLDLILADKSPTSHRHDGETIIPDVVEFQTPAIIPTAIGSTYYDAANKVLSTILDGAVLQNGLEMYVRVVNKTGVQINDGQAVYISGAQGNRPTATLAKADASVTSDVIGVATMNIPKNQEGFVTVFGSVDYNTTGLTDGGTLYLSGTVAGALTETEQAYPLHKVVVATALNSTVAGKIFVRPYHIFELAELHGVDLTDTAPTDTDSAITKVGAAIKVSTFSSIYTYIKDKLLAASHTFSQLITFSEGVKTSSIVPNSASFAVMNEANNANVLSVKTTPVASLEMNGNISAYGRAPAPFFPDGAVVAFNPNGNATFGSGFCVLAKEASFGGFTVGYETTAPNKWLIGISSAVTDRTGLTFFEDSQSAKPRLTLRTGGNVGINTTNPQSRLQVNGAIQMADDTAAASLTKEGAIRYRKNANNSYVEMCMQTGASTYAWVIIKQNTW